jgi:hypothetical protein
MAVPTPTPGSEPDTTDSADPQRVGRAEDEPPAHTTELVALLDDTPDGPQATVCPVEADATEIVTTWLTVDTDHLLDLDDWR